MAQRRDKMTYSVNGSAAYQPSYGTPGRESTARPLPERKPERRQAPARQPRRQPRKVVHEKIAIAPFGVLGIALALGLLVLVLFGYVQIYESGSQVSDLQDRLTELKEENHKLQSEFDNAVDLQQVEKRAMELGMQRPSAKQSVSVEVPVEDVTVISGRTHSSPVRTAVLAVYETARDLVEYLRRR